MKINNKFEIGQIVYLITDPLQEKRMITSITVYKNGSLFYTVVKCNIVVECEDFEMSANPDQATILGLDNQNQHDN